MLTDDYMLNAALLCLERRGEIFRRTGADGVERWFHMDYLPRAEIRRLHASGSDVQTIASRMGISADLVRRVLDAQPPRRRTAK
jgi:DNA invertase Pin-like site-specific DNA recombinase